MAEQFELVFVTGYQACGKTWMMERLKEEGYCTLDFDDVIEDIIQLEDEERMPTSWVYTQVRKAVVPRIVECRVAKSLELGLNHLVIGGLFDFASDTAYYDFTGLIATQLRLVVDMPVRTHLFFIDTPHSQTLANMLKRELQQDDDPEHVVHRRLVQENRAADAVNHTLQRVLAFLKEWEDMRLIAEQNANCSIMERDDIMERVRELCYCQEGGVDWSAEDQLIREMRRDFEQQLSEQKRRQSRRSKKNTASPK